MLDRTNCGDKVDLNTKGVSIRVFEGKRVRFRAFDAPLLVHCLQKRQFVDGFGVARYTGLTNYKAYKLSGNRSHAFDFQNHQEKKP